MDKFVSKYHMEMENSFFNMASPILIDEDGAGANQKGVGGPTAKKMQDL